MRRKALFTEPTSAAVGKDTVDNIRSLADGQEAGVRWLCDNFLPALTRYSRTRLGARRKVADEEDVALEAIRVFAQAMRDGRFTDVESRDDLWRILLGIAYRTAQAELRKATAQRRGGGDVRGESMFHKAYPQGAAPAGLDDFEDRRTDAETVEQVVDRCRELLGPLGELDQQIVLLKLQGHTHREIAAQLGYSEGHVERRVAAVRKTWAAARQ